MEARRFWKFNYTDALNKWIGFDLPKNDFVYPHGTGEVADFEVYIDWDGDWIPRYRGMTVEIRFQDPYSGYYETKKNLESEFKGPYTAEPHRRYLQSAEFSEKVLSDGEIEERHFDKSKCWVVRSRCKVDDQGKLISANYSVVHDILFACKRNRKGGFCVAGSFNPVPNDTNLEMR